MVCVVDPRIDLFSLCDAFIYSLIIAVQGRTTRLDARLSSMQVDFSKVFEMNYKCHGYTLACRRAVSLKLRSRALTGHRNEELVGDPCVVLHEAALLNTPQYKNTLRHFTTRTVTC